MSDAVIEAWESEASGYESEGEAFGEAYESEATGEAYESEATGEAYESEATSEAWPGYGEDSRSDARRRRQTQMLQARQAQMRRQGPRPLAQPSRRPPPPPPQRVTPTVPGTKQAVAAVRAEVRSRDLDTQAALLRLRRELSELKRKGNRKDYLNTWAAETGVLASQALDSFETHLRPRAWLRALIRGAPTLLLSPGKQQRPGVQGVLYDPRVTGTVALGGIFAIGHFTRGTQTPRANSVQLTIPPAAVAGLAAAVTAAKAPIPISAIALTKTAGPLDPGVLTFIFTSSPPGIVVVAQTAPGAPTATLTTAAPAGTPVWINVTAGGQSYGQYITT